MRVDIGAGLGSMIFHDDGNNARSVFANVMDKIHEKPSLKNMTSDVMNTAVNKLTAEYHDTLIKRHLCLSREEIKALDTIDIRSLLDEHDSSRREDIVPLVIQPTRAQFTTETGWLACIPCFAEGIIRANTFRYIYFKIQDVNTAEKSIQIYLHDYIYAKGVYTPGTSGTVSLSASDNENPSSLIVKEHDDAMPFSKIYRQLSQKDLNWSDSDYFIWKELILANADMSEQTIRPLTELAKAFIAMIVSVNEQLWLNKSKRKIITHAIAKFDKQPTHMTDPVSQPSKVTRVIGKLNISSRTVPKLPTKRSIAVYRTSAWTTRGHIRTLKSGKKVPVKASVHKRHALNTNDNVASVELKFKK